MNRIFTTVLGCLLLFSSCSKKEEKPTLFTLLTPEQTGINFTNTVTNTKDFNIFKYRNFYNGGGVAIGDINNDNLPDIYFTSNQGENKLYLNKGNFQFEDITEKAGVKGEKAWSTGVVLVDINHDNLLDIYVCNAGNVAGDNQENELFINNGDLTFTEKAKDYNLADSGFTTHAAFFDYDKDGDLDVYILNNSFIPVNSLGYNNKRDLRAEKWNVDGQYLGGGDKLMRNDNGKFIDVSEEAGIYGSLIGFGLGVTIGDVNNDLYPDIYVSNDFYERDYLYINNHDGTFKESIQDWASHLSFSSMGADMADINNDGNPDLFVTDMLPEGDQRLKETTKFENYDLFSLLERQGFHHQYMQNTLQLNTGDGYFSEIANFSGVSKTDWSWGALLFDMDNDGYRDIYVSNGIAQDLTDQDFIDFFANDFLAKMESSGQRKEIDCLIVKMPKRPISNYAFKNNSDLTFTDETTNWGFNIKSFSNGSAYADLDNDGDLDLVVNNVNSPSFIFKNNAQEQQKNNFIKLQLEGDSLNTKAIGSIVKVFTNHQIIRNELIPSRGFQSSIDYIMTIGLGKNNIDSLCVIWPNNKTETLKNIALDTLTVLHQKNAKQYIQLEKQTVKPLLTEIIENHNLVKHEENDYIDFDYEALVAKMLSREGPTVAIGDINADGNDDVFVGGGFKQSATIYIQNNNAQLIATKQPELELDKIWEDTASLFFDADGDGDLDLVVGSGGNERQFANKYINKLYFNDGKGNFTRSTNYIPTNYQNISKIIAHDFDGDGDLDLFMATRSIPGVYGMPPQHLLLENDGKGNFKDVLKTKAPILKNAGMLTDAVWADINNDGKKELITVGDWEAPTMYSFNGKTFEKLATNLDNELGWWNTITTADVNNDGLVDLIIGNQGENTSYKTSKEAPMKMYVKDFDFNGTTEQIVTRTINGKDKPIALKAELTAQLTYLKKKSLKYAEYAKKSIQDLFDEKALQNTVIKQTNTSKSIVAINDGKGNFKIQALPSQVQLSCVCSIVCNDINNDGNLDLIMGGNSMYFRPQFGSLDANRGSVLLGDSKGNFSWLKNRVSGLNITGEVKQIKTFKNKNGKTYLFVARNNDTPKIYTYNE
ncbi:VCBS repeat-containing protein [Zhouia sp. PK063]|uniref:VCBS repeat-containing protein n=1 Tax=Zhouia sp. PK063 TaxID=3373602 RepID=UPI0037BB176C